MQEQQHAREEQHHLPHRDERVDKVAGLLQPVLDLAEGAHGCQRATSVHKVLPPAGRDQEDGDGDGPCGRVAVVDLDHGPDEEAGGLAADGYQVHQGF